MIGCYLNGILEANFNERASGVYQVELNSFVYQRNITTDNNISTKRRVLLQGMHQDTRIMCHSVMRKYANGNQQLPDKTKNRNEKKQNKTEQESKITHA